MAASILVERSTSILEQVSLTGLLLSSSRQGQWRELRDCALTAQKLEECNALMYGEVKVEHPKEC